MFVADLAATCAPVATTPAVVDPFLIVEVLSPSTRAFDLQIKVKRYSRLASVGEIWLVDSERRWVQVWQRSGEVWSVRILEARESFDSAGRPRHARRDLPQRQRRGDRERPARGSRVTAPLDLAVRAARVGGGAGRIATPTARPRARLVVRGLGARA